MIVRYSLLTFLLDSSQLRPRRVSIFPDPPYLFLLLLFFDDSLNVTCRMLQVEFPEDLGIARSRSRLHLPCRYLRPWLLDVSLPRLAIGILQVIYRPLGGVAQSLVSLLELDVNDTKISFWPSKMEASVYNAEGSMSLWIIRVLVRMTGQTQSPESALDLVIISCVWDIEDFIVIDIDRRRHGRFDVA